MSDLLEKLKLILSYESGSDDDADNEILFFYLMSKKLKLPNNMYY